jgi:hypothetical protein
LPKHVKFSEKVTIYYYKYNQDEIIDYTLFIKDIVLNIIEGLLETDEKIFINIKKQPTIYSLNNIIKYYN